MINTFKGYNVCKYITRIWKLQYCIFQEISHHYTHEIQSQLQKLKILANYSSKFSYAALHCLRKKKIQNYYITVRSPTLDKWLQLTYQSRRCPSASQVPIKETSWLVYPTTYDELSSPVTGLGLSLAPLSYITQPFLFCQSLGLLVSWDLGPLFPFLPPSTPTLLTCFCSVKRSCSLWNLPDALFYL